ncbi:hypothetical protein I0C86_36035 [Plantactinospora sp. S1510]|uniref:Tetratricopeptide repeat protein n=1 Tax=Plantactinospora alkalitolerans TaxID=2789879 RepID=A0ABS0H759_9ACTN|nr:hypothetical protein [Plantactinospora alkalitolerans]MBF9134302.1 hypothetical protein [Plantactinospora alkalitolerans]
MSDGLGKAWELVQSGDAGEVVRHLRSTVDSIALGDLARLLERVAELVGLTDLAGAAARLANDPEHPQALYDFGYACVEHGLAFVAVPALREAVRRVPDADGVLAELVAALEDEHRHAEAVATLEQRDTTLPPWPHRYLLVYNAIMAGDLDRATRHFDRLPAPEDQDWRPAHQRVQRMLGRAGLVGGVGGVGRLDGADLRGWHFVLTGGVLASLSPYGFDAGMTGRYAYQQDSFGLCRLGLDRLELILGAAGRRPRSVSLLPDRSSRILGHAVARVLGVPAEPFTGARPESVVVAYDLAELDDGELLTALRERAPGQVLFEHATCWTDPPVVSADVSTMLTQVVVAPWGERLRQGPDGGIERGAADERPVEEIAADILRADGEPDPGDGATPADPDGALVGFVSAVAGRWLAGPRDRVRSPGPVPSSRFR